MKLLIALFFTPMVFAEPIEKNIEKAAQDAKKQIQRIERNVRKNLSGATGEKIPRESSPNDDAAPDNSDKDKEKKKD